MALPNKKWWEYVLPGCLKTKTSTSAKPSTQLPTQNSFQRLSLSDLSNPGSPLSVSDISNSRIGSNLHVFALTELQVITHNFSSSNFLGEGGFGPVYKGFIDDKVRPGLEAQPVAVKVLDLQGHQGHQEWLAEVIFLGQLRHPHLVKLIGYCCEDAHRLLVYEYMARGNLENQLFKRYSQALPWLTRIKIAVGAAKGLAFLHEEQKPVIYRDFKASNILLDADYTAKLSDFGLAKDGPQGDDTHVTTRVMGTQGYAAPEYIMTGHLTTMSDVYSFGVVFLELLTGRRSMDKNRPRKEQSLVEWAKRLLKEPVKLEQIMDLRLEGRYSIEGAKRAAKLAQQCLSHQPKLRPKMGDVIKTLEQILGLDDIPMGPFVYIVQAQDEKENNVQKNGVEKIEEHKEKNLKKKGHRHRHWINSSRSPAIYSDTALHTSLANKLYSPRKEKRRGERRAP